MAYYDALVAKWPTLPAGTTAQKLANINAQTVTTAARPAILTVNAIINAILSADLLALTTVQLQVMTLLLAGSGTVDASAGTTVRGVFQTIFAGKTATIANLTALVSPFDSPTALWWQANGYLAPINGNDLIAAGNLT